MTNRQRAFVAFLGFFAVAAVWLWPVVRSIGYEVPGTGGDPYQTLWRFVRFGQVLRHGTVVIPEEGSISNFGPLPWMPIHLLAGEASAYTVAWLLSAVFSGWWTYVLARLWGARHGPAFVAGLLVMFSPYRVSQALGHFGALQLWWIPAVFSALTLWARTRSWRWALGSGLLIVGTAWTEHQLFVTLALALAIAAVWYSSDVWAHVRRSLGQGVAVGILVIALGIMPFGKTLGVTASPESFLNRGQEERERFSASLESLFLPPPFHIFRDGLRGYGTPVSSVADHVHGVGLLLPIIVVLLLTRRPVRRYDGVLVTMAAVGLVLALGPSLTIGSVRVPLPASLLDHIPVLSALRTLGRFVGLAVVALPVLLARRWPFAPPFVLASGALALVLLTEIAPAFGYPHVPVDRRLALVLAKRPAGAVLVIPAYTNYQIGSEHLYLSAYHGHPLVANAAFERTTDPETFRDVLATPVVGDLATLRVGALDRPAVFGERLADIAPLAFRAWGIRTVLLEAAVPGGLVSLEGDVRSILADADVNRVRAFLRDTLGLPELVIRDHVFLYDVPENRASRTSILAIRGQGFRLVERNAAMTVLAVGPRARLTLVAAEDQSGIACLIGQVRGTAHSITAVTTDGLRVVGEPTRDGRIALPLGSVHAGRQTVSLELDAATLLLENPHIRTSADMGCERR